MPIQLDNAQYNAFVSFALGANDENAIAHAAGAAPADPLAGRTISARTGDSVHALTRTTDSRKANDAARELFRKAIVQIFGGEKRIPPSVRKALRGMIQNDLLLEANKLSGYMARIGAAGIGVDLVRASVLEVMSAVPEHSEELMNETSLLIPPKDGGTMSMLVGAMPAVRELAAEL